MQFYSSINDHAKEYCMMSTWMKSVEWGWMYYVTLGYVSIRKRTMLGQAQWSWTPICICIFSFAMHMQIQDHGQVVPGNTKIG